MFAELAHVAMRMRARVPKGWLMLPLGLLVRTNLDAHGLGQLAAATAHVAGVGHAFSICLNQLSP